MSVRCEAPPPGEYVVPVESVKEHLPLQPFLTCLTTEFRDARVDWDEILPEVRTGLVHAIRVELCVWPMVVRERRQGDTYLLRRSLPPSCPDSIVA